MKIGDLVRAEHSEKVGIVVEIIQKKCWRTWRDGPHIDWRKVDPEPHGVVLYSHNDGTVEIPAVELILV
ncbi:hypothetical protein OAA09_01375 [bacterium]|nr:hypothetical protein [bacterium]